MLQVKDIKKEYKTGDLVQKALDGVSLNLRDNEFVAILGPSGSGKTTLLNIIGGLDRYDSGDLIINGISTKKYKDRDWDSYRNHTIGFVFQSYNLIMHQSVLSNVELALTISGISGSERRERAIKALEKVGLGEQLHKKPNQMSGGQMQRVAIARALVNDPDIVLADEPTGALDSETSVQVMDLLKEVAKDRLVVMVTHNPELAQEYATRIITIKDGKKIGDTDPFEIDEKKQAPPIHKNLGKASMSFLTALSLSFNNLKTKKARTFMVSFAGSIGIIGIALILALSSGVNAYIEAQEATTLSEYPLQIEQTGYDLTSFMSGSSGGMFSASAESERKTDRIGVQQIADTMFDGVSNNDLGSLKAYLESGETDIYDYVKSIEYTYDITPQIYMLEGNETYQLNPNRMFSSLSTGGMGITTMMSGMMGSSIFTELPSEPSLYEDNYDVVAGHWPEDSHELVLVLSSNGDVSDILLYQLGIKDREELEQKVKDFMETTGSTSITVEDESDDSNTGEDEVITPTEVSTDGGSNDNQNSESADENAEDTQTGESTDENAEDTQTSDSTEDSDTEETFSYDDFLGRTFKLVNNSDYYTYDAEYAVWTDKSDNKSFVEELVKNGEDLTIVGVVQPVEDATVMNLSQGIAYPSELIIDIIEKSAESEVVKAQLKDPDTNVFSGKEFGDEDDSDFDMSKLFSVDEDALADAFNVDTDGLDMDSLDFGSMDMSSMDMSSLDFSSMDLGSMMDMNSLASALPSSDSAIADALAGIKIEPTENATEELGNLLTSLVSGYQSYAESNNYPTLTDLGASVSSYLQGSGRTILEQQITATLNELGAVVTDEDVTNLVNDIFDGYVNYLYANYEIEELTPNVLTESFNTYVNSADVQSMITGLTGAAGEKVRNIFNERLDTITQALADGYNQEVANNTDGIVDPSDVTAGFTKYVSSPEAQNLVMDSASKIIKTDELMNSVSNTVSGMMGSVASSLGSQLSGAIEKIMTQVMTQLTSTLTSAMTEMMTGLTGNIGDMFNMNTDAFANMISTNFDAGEIQELMTSLMSGNTASYESNLSSMGYADVNEPTSINIYSRDFDAKNEVVNIIDGYNTKMRDAGEEDKVITYTDIVSTMMSSVTDIINAISYVLIAFVGISLVVSSIMIGVITYISVLERRKEIGILRAIGASKHNIAQVFNAETFITGLLAGAIGVTVSEILIVPINMIIKAVTEQDGIRAILPIQYALVLVVLSIVLTVIAGLMPSRKASKSDPVTALRTD